MTRMPRKDILATPAGDCQRIRGRRVGLLESEAGPRFGGEKRLNYIPDPVRPAESMSLKTWPCGGL